MDIRIEGNLTAQDYINAAVALILHAAGLKKTPEITINNSGSDERFQRLSDGWIRDSLNRIDWGPSSGHVMNFDKSKEHCKAAGGRLPTLKELHSIVDYGRNKPAVDTVFFGDTKTDDWYWTDTPVSGDAGYVWCVKFFYGFVGYGHQDLTNYVRPVRPSQ